MPSKTHGSVCDKEQCRYSSLVMAPSARRFRFARSRSRVRLDSMRRMICSSSEISDACMVVIFSARRSAIFNRNNSPILRAVNRYLLRETDSTISEISVSEVAGGALEFESTEHSIRPKPNEIYEPPLTLTLTSYHDLFGELEPRRVLDATILYQFDTAGTRSSAMLAFTAEPRTFDDHRDGD